MTPDLGKYAVEVMSAYAVSVVLIVALVVISLRQSTRARAMLSQLEAARQAKAAGGRTEPGEQEVTRDD